MIASKSPVAINAIKENIVYSRDHSVAEGLNNINTINRAMIITEDIQKSVEANMQKKVATFHKL